MKKIVDIWINCPSREVADDISARLMAERLVACSNCYPEIASRYSWKGRIEEASEVPLLVKTRKELFGAVAERVRDIHPYETPSIIGVDISEADAAYVDWVYEETEG